MTDMTGNSLLSMDQMTEVLDGMPVAIYVRAEADGRLLYANPMAQELFFRSSCPENICFDREFQNPADGRIYQCHGKAIDWGGIPAYMGHLQEVSSQKLMEEELSDANEKMQEIINAIPGGVAIYKVTDIFETVYFSDGVPELSGYTVEEYQELVKQDAAEMTYWEDSAMVVERAKEVIQSRGAADFEFRKQHRDGHIVWVHVRIKWMGEENGCPLLHCVFHNISDLKEAQSEMECLINSIPGGIASYRVEHGRFIPIFYSDGVMALSGHGRSDNQEPPYDMFDMIYEMDRERVHQALQEAFISGEPLEVSYRLCHKDGSLIWIHLNGQRMEPLSGNARFYAIFTGMSAEGRLFQSMANETADGIYVIDKRNYDLLYVNESRNAIMKVGRGIGKKCYQALFGKEAVCEFCTLDHQACTGEEHEMRVEETGRIYRTRFREVDWNGIPSYVRYIRDITEEVQNRRERERLEMYFKTVVERIPGGIAVICCLPDGSMMTEFISDGLAAMLHMTQEEAGKLLKGDGAAGIHPEDREIYQQELHRCVESGEGTHELTCRMRCGEGTYAWVRIVLSTIQSTDGVRRLYCAYADISKNVEEKEEIRHRYEDLILQHYRAPGPDALVIGHCNVTRNRILDITDYTDSDLLKSFGTVREEFFTGIAGLIVEEGERRKFLDTYLNGPLLEAFKRRDREHIMACFVKLPKDEMGRYVQIQVNLVETPDTGDITGILTVTDVTEQTISDGIRQQLFGASHEMVVDVRLDQDFYEMLSGGEHVGEFLEASGCFSRKSDQLVQNIVVPKDRESFARHVNPEEIRRRLETEESYTFSVSLYNKNRDIRTKNITISRIDMRLGRVCLVSTDITDSLREQQGLLNMMAYTFEVLGFVNISEERFTVYTRQVVLENLPPYVIDHYNQSIYNFVGDHVLEGQQNEIARLFHIETMLKRLEETPAGYDFVFPYYIGEEMRYKQVNVLWGDENHRTICMVRADVTDMLAAEHETKETLEKALNLAKEANLAKSDFLSAMSHDIRTPMNAIIGMTALASAHLDQRDRVEDCLKKITVASKHLLSLINDVLDLSRIERSKLMLNCMDHSIQDLITQLTAIIEPQAKDSGLQFSVKAEGIRHNFFHGDSLRISQILINLLSNAVKFTPEGGLVEFQVEEIPPVKGEGQVRYRFTVRDTGIGMPDEFLADIFAPFIRRQGTEYIEGTGLGLSITKGLVDLMEGEISVQSQIGTGSAFFVELECRIAGQPVTEARDNGKASHAEAGRAFAGRCFLVAEDNAINAEILCELLWMYGAKTQVTKNGTEAVRAFAAAEPETYDAILMDIQMPEMNGYEATRMIRKMQRPDAKSIPIIALTANAFAEDIQTSVESGMDGHVSKPVDMNVLHGTLYSLLNR